MRNYTRFIPGEEIGDIAQWQFNAVDTSALRAREQARALEEALAQEKHAHSHQEGYAAGYAAGFEQGHAQATLEGQRQINAYVNEQGQAAGERFAQVFLAAQRQLDAADQAIASGVLEIVCALARQVIRQELSINPKALQPVVREAIDMLVADNKGALVRLNPQDVAVLHDGVHSEFPDLALKLVADAAVAPGGCLVEAAGTVIDGGLEKRWLRAIANLGLTTPWEVPEDAN
jgi:flagellar assembly protein FliH